MNEPPKYDPPHSSKSLRCLNAADGLWLLPSRDRPLSLARFFAAYRVTHAEAPGLILLNRLDYTRHQAHFERPNGAVAAVMPLNWRVVPTTETTLGTKLNRGVEVTLQTAPQNPPKFFGYVQDDLVPLTPGWDTLLAAAIEQAPFVSANDLLIAPKGTSAGQIKNRATGAWAIDSRLVQALGWFFPVGVDHLYGDLIWEELGKTVPGLRVHLSGVVLEHRHASRSPHPDETHRSIYNAEAWNIAQGQLLRFRDEHWNRAVQICENFMENRHKAAQNRVNTHQGW